MEQEKRETPPFLEKTLVDPHPSLDHPSTGGNRVPPVAQSHKLNRVREPTEGGSAEGQCSAGKRVVSRRLSSTLPPVAKLLVLDEQSDEDGELIRLRWKSTCVGRSDGRIVLPHDTELSARHFQIDRIETDDVSAGDEPSFAWRLRDLESTNGTFVRVWQLELEGETEFRLGRGHYLWTSMIADPQQGLRAECPTIVSLSEGGGKWEIRDQRPETLGHVRADVSLRLADDPSLDDHHATISPIDGGRWVLCDHGSVNGTWQRVIELVLEDGTEILAGGQRFRFHR